MINKFKVKDLEFTVGDKVELTSGAKGYIALIAKYLPSSAPNRIYNFVLWLTERTKDVYGWTSNDKQQELYINPMKGGHDDEDCYWNCSSRDIIAKYENNTRIQTKEMERIELATAHYRTGFTEEQDSEDWYENTRTPVDGCTCNTCESLRRNTEEETAAMYVEEANDPDNSSLLDIGHVRLHEPALGEDGSV